MFCFVRLRSLEPLCFMPCSWYLEKVLDECIDLVWDCLELWWWSYLIIEPFSQWKLNKIKTENCIEIWGHSCCCWKDLEKSEWIDSISQFSELRCWRYYFWSGFCCWKFKHIVKIGFDRKSQLSTQFVHTWATSTCYGTIGERITTVAKAYGIKVKWVIIGNSMLWSLEKEKRRKKKLARKVHCPLSKWKVNSKQSTIQVESEQ